MDTVTVTPAQDAVTGEIFIAAPPERVFQAITDPKQMPQWWGQQGMYRITEWTADLRPGGKWSSVGIGADGTVVSRGWRISGDQSASAAGSHLDCELEWIAENGGPLGTGAAQRSRLAACRPAEDGDRHGRKNPSGGFCRRSASSPQSRPGVDACAWMDAGVRGEG